MYFHTLLLSAAILLAAPAASAPVSLKSSVRAFAPSLLPNVMLTEATFEFDGIDCPAATVVHEGVQAVPTRPDVFWVPHSLIVQNGLRCGSGGAHDYMLLVNGVDVATKEAAAAKGLSEVRSMLEESPRAVMAFENAHALENVHVGIELATDRRCGGAVRYPKGSIFLFVNPMTVGVNLGYTFFAEGSLGMLSVLPNDGICAFCNGPKSNGGNPSPAPTTPVAPPPANPFALSTSKLPA